MSSPVIQVPSKCGGGDGQVEAIIAAGEGADVELVDDEILKRRGGERDTVGGEEVGVDDVALATRCGALDLEGTSVGAQVRLGGVVVWPRGSSDEELVACVRQSPNAVGRPVGRPGFIGERVVVPGLG
jgi:hypothetical protein